MAAISFCSKAASSNTFERPRLHEWTKGKKRFHDKVRASSSAPAASAKTEKLSEAFTPKESVIARAKSVNKPQVAHATGDARCP
jgi:hypothetical protein